MSALTDLFTSFANKIRSKVGGSQTYTPLEMIDAIDDVYDAGAASVPTPTPITPSNSSPVALTADTPVNPTASGYAIESYSDIDLAYVVEVSLYPGAMYRAISQGYAIDSYQVKTPNKFGVSFNPGYVRMNAGGYAYSEIQTQINMGVPDIISSANISASSSRTITVTQKPKYIVYFLDRYTYTDGRGALIAYDVTNNCFSVSNYTADGYSSGKNYSGLPESLTSVTSSSVVLKNAYAQAIRTHVFIYY